MIELPSTPAPNGVNPTLISNDIIQRPSSGAALSVVGRPGSRYRVEVSWPPMKPDVARVFVARFLRAKRQGLRIDYPLLGVDQGFPGNTAVVDQKIARVNGSGQSGTSLALHAMVPGYQFREGYWFTMIDPDARRYLHCCLSDATVNGSGQATLQIEPALRAPFPDGSDVLISTPTIEGIIPEDVSWALSVDRLVRGGGIVIEEAA